ncbi:MAG: pilin [Patescibacteria group bacterium]|nr:pilin [Patescibacteria group bacterium]
MSDITKVIVLLLMFFLANFLVADKVLAYADCNEIGASWNQEAQDVFIQSGCINQVDSSPAWECDCFTGSQANIWVVKDLNCTSCKNKKTPKCYRAQDCESLGGQCRNNKNKAQLERQGYIEIPWHCKQGASNTCFVTCEKNKEEPVETVEPEEEEPITEKEDPIVEKVDLPKATSTPEKPLERTQDYILEYPDGCCQQIVPPLDQTRYNYGLNHLLQVAINIYKCILCIVGSLMMLMIVIGGFTMIMAAGDSGKINGGKQIIKAAVIGGLIVLTSYLIVGFAVKAFGGAFKNDTILQIDSGK